MTIGVDIGGTHTDAVLVVNEKIVAKVKVATTEKLEEGFHKAVEALLPFGPVKEIKVGSTHALNALLEKKGLSRVGLIRLAGHRPLLAPTMSECVTVDGGNEFDGRSITQLVLSQIDEAIEILQVEQLVIAGAFSPFFPEQELEVAAYIGKHYPHIEVTLSHKLGGLGMIERENASILNGSLRKTVREGFSKLQRSDVPIVLTQNNGCTLSLEEALEYPLLTLATGPTHSFIGAAKLAGLEEAIVIDIGGTSTDIGVVQRGVPRRSLATSMVGGIPLNFPMPDLLSLSVGGGSHVSLNPLTIGPNSCSKHLKKQALSFGGPQLTLTDVALAAGHFEMEGATPIAVRNVRKVFSYLFETLEKIVAKLGDGPTVLVGGGAALLPPSGFRVPEHYEVANAYGAALAEESATVDRVLSLEQRDRTLDLLREELVQRLQARGCSSITIDIVEVTPYTYLPGNLARYYLSARGKN